MLLLSFSACQTTITPTATPEQIPTTTLTPFVTPTQIPTLTPEPDPFALAEPILYDIDKEIWVNIEGTIENGEPTFFTFSGVERQQIYVYFQYPSIVGGGWIAETKISDKNGDLIEPDSTTDMGGWRGQLPSTQDYLISLIPIDDQKVEFILQFINIPPRHESGYFTYFDEQNGFEITYSQDDFKPYINEGLDDVFSVTMDADKYFKDTILQLSHVVISVEPHFPNVKCSELLSESYYSTKETINGISFEKFDLHDAATGTEAELLFFITAHNDRCYTIFVKTLYVRMDKFPDTDKKDFSRSLLYTKVYRLLNTFRFIA